MTGKTQFQITLPVPTPKALADIRLSLIEHFGKPAFEGQRERWTLPDPAEVPTKLGPIKLCALPVPEQATLEVPFSLRSWVHESTGAPSRVVQGRGLNRFAYDLRMPFLLSLFGADCWIYRVPKGAE